MISKSFLAATILLLLILFVVSIVAGSYVPSRGDSFSYHEVSNIGSGTGDYNGYTEQTTYDGMEAMNAVSADGIVMANYSYSYTWSNSTGATVNGNSAGDFTFSSINFLYVNGTDDQTGYVNPTVWFYMDNSIPQGGTFSLLNTQMTIISTHYNYYLPSQNKNVNVIFAQGNSNYQRNDIYGQFNAAYTWKAYFDPSTGYIVGYDYVEHDTNSSGTGFTYTEDLYVTSTSYPLVAASATNPGGGGSNVIQYSGYIIELVIVLVVIIVILSLIYAFLRRHRKKLPQHTYQQPLPQGPPPENISLTPKQPPVQQIVIKEVVKVNCRYCGALIDSTAETCPICGAPRT